MISYGLPHTANEQDLTDQLGALTEAARLGRPGSPKKRIASASPQAVWMGETPLASPAESALMRTVRLLL
jgi:hypothetical protein